MHRDIKPDNIIGARYIVKIWTSHRQARRATALKLQPVFDNHRSPTDAGLVLGTVAYFRRSSARPSGDAAQTSGLWACWFMKCSRVVRHSRGDPDGSLVIILEREPPTSFLSKDAPQSYSSYRSRAKALRRKETNATRRQQRYRGLKTSAHTRPPAILEGQSTPSRCALCARLDAFLTWSRKLRA